MGKQTGRLGREKEGWAGADKSKWQLEVCGCLALWELLWPF